MAGTYLLTFNAYTTAAYFNNVIIYKNGAEYVRGTYNEIYVDSVANVATVLVQANGTTDYFEAYVWSDGANTRTLALTLHTSPAR